jgi:hypothetical protein
MQRTQEQPTQVSRPDPRNVIGVCGYCGTPDVARVLVTDEDGSSNSRLVCADPASCAGPRPETPAETLAGILGDPIRFRATIAAQMAAVTAPTDVADGDYVVTDAGLKVLADAGPSEAPGTAARVLRSAALYVERHGWIQGAYYDATAQTFTPAACMVGAIAMVCYGGPVDAPAQHFDDPGFLDFEEAVLHLDRYLLAEDGSESYEFNDAQGRRLEDVTRVLRDAASRPADELIDAIRAIDARNAQTAVLVDLLKPRGLWDDPATSADPAGDDA